MFQICSLFEHSDKYSTEFIFNFGFDVNNFIYQRRCVK